MTNKIFNLVIGIYGLLFWIRYNRSKKIYRDRNGMVEVYLMKLIKKIFKFDIKINIRKIGKTLQERKGDIIEHKYSTNVIIEYEINN